MSEQLTLEHFIPYLQQVFRVTRGHYTLTLVQLDVLPLGEAQAQVTGRPPFTLIFSGPPNDVLPEGLHTIEAEDGTSFLIYVIPIQTASRDKQDYQAVFN
jgi:hypothetical protein